MSATFALLLACGGGGPKSDTDTDSTTGEDTFGMGETSANPTDPTSPTTPTTSASSASSATVTSASTITSASDVTTDPTITTTTTDPSDVTTDPTITISASDTVTTTPPETTDPTMPVECMDPPAQEQDATCLDMSGCGCASGKCFSMPILGGWCGECLGDADCPGGGCTTPNPVASVGSVCNLGKPGDGCETDAACNDPAFAKCSPVLKVDGILTVATCGACKTNIDCAQGVKNCTPQYDLENFAGMFECVPDASVPNNEGCNLQLAGDQPIGNKACQSGFCGEANIMGLVKLGI
ncbi:MAG TPA: hypothetical protein VGB85_11580, partial [Nannocystis sp.]